LNGALGVANGGTGTTTGGVTNGVEYYDGTKLTNGSGFTYNGTTVGIGTTTATNSLYVSYSSGANAPTIDLAGGGAGVAPGINFMRARGAPGALTTVLNGDNTIGIQGNAYDGTAYRANFTIGATVDGTVSSGVVPTDILFKNMNASGVLTQSMTILANGNLGIGTTTPASKLSVVGSTYLAGSLYASSTVQFSNITNGLLAADATGNVTATTSLNIGQYLNGALGVANGGTGSTTLGGILKGNGAGSLLAAIGDTDYQKPITLTTSGTSGAATFIGDTLNIPQYSGTAYTGTYPVQVSGSVISLAFGTTTSNLWGGTQTFTNSPIFSTLGAGTVNATAGGTVYSTATSSATLGLGLSYSGTLGAFVGGSSGSLSIATSSLYAGTTGQVPYFSGTNTLTATSSLFIGTSGAIGIGTTTNTNSLYISYSNALNAPSIDVAAAGASSAAGLNFFRARGAPGAITTVLNGDSTIGIQGNAYDGTSYKTNFTIGATVDGTVSTGVVPTDIVFKNTNAAGTLTQNMTLLANGNLGLGTTTPVSKLSVVGSTYLAGALTATSTVQFTGITNGLLAADATGNVTSTTSLNIGQYLNGALGVANGGTGSTTLGGILRGNGTGAVQSVTIGSGLAFDGTTLSTTGAGITQIGPAGQLQSGGTQTLATTTSTFNGLTSAVTITAAGNVQTFTPSLSGTLGVAGGGTGQSTFTSGQLLYGNGTNGLSSVATTSATLGLGLSGSLTTIGGSQTLSIATSSLYAGTVGQVPYFSGTNTLTATSSLFLATSGNVGIATTTPAAKLSVVGSTYLAGALTATSTVQFTGITSGLLAADATGNITSTTSLNVGQYLNGALGVANGGTGTTTGGVTNGVEYYDGTKLTNSSGFVYTGNNVGIGTTSPFAALSIATSSANFTGQTLLSVANPSNVTLFTVLGNGNVGVGTSSPTFGISYNAASRVLGITGDGSASASASGVLALGNNRATPTNGDSVGTIDFTSTGNGLSSLQIGSRIRGILDGAGGSNGIGQDLVFSTKADNGALAEQLRVTSGDNGNGSLEVAGTNTGSTTMGSVYGIHEANVFNPRNTPQFVFGEYLTPTLNVYSGSSIFSYVGENVQPILGPSFTGSLTNVLGYEAGDITNNSAFTPPNFYQFIALGSANGNGVTSGVIDNRDYEAGASTAGAGTGGTVNNTSYFANVPTGTGAGSTNNYGLRITGNGGSGGSGTTKNYSIYNDSLAASYFAGNVGISTSSPFAPLSVAGSTYLGGNVTATGTVQLTGITSGLLAASSNGTVSATTSLNIGQYLNGALGVANGGTASTTLGGILAGNGTSAVKSVLIGSGLTWDGTTLAATAVGGGTNVIATSSSETAGQLSYWTTTAGYPAKLGSVATTSATLGLGLSGSLTTIGGSQTLSIATSSLYAGTVGQVPYFSGTNTITATSSLFIGANGGIGIGTTTTSNSLYVNYGSALNVPSIELAVAGANAPAALNFLRARGNTSTLASVISGDATFAVQGNAFDGTSYKTNFTIGATVDGTVSTGIVPTDILFKNMNASGVLTQSMTLLANGNLGVGTTSPAAKLSIVGSTYLAGSLYASSTVQFSAITSGLLAADATGNVTATSSLNIGQYLNGALGVANGGTGSTTLSGLLTGNGTGQVTSAVVSAPLGFSGNTLSLNTDSTLQVSGNNLGINLTHGNTWTGLQQFNGNASSTQFTSTGNTYLATLGSANVGIGTTSPETELTVVRSTGARSWTSTVGMLALLEKSASASNNVGMDFVSGSAGTDTINFGNTTAESIGSIKYDTSLMTLSFTNSSNQALTIDQFGNTGIGTTTPQAPLDVTPGSVGARSWTPSAVALFEKSITSPTSLNIDLVSGATGSDVINFGDTAAEAQGKLQYDNSIDALSLWSNGNQQLTINSTGSVGIGTTTPDSSLTVTGSGGTGRTWATNASNVAVFDRSGLSLNSATVDIVGGITGSDVLNFGDSASENQGRISYSNATDLMTFATGGTASAYLTSGGNFGVGSSTPTSLLSVEPTASGNATTQLFAVASSTNATILTVLGNGNVGIGTSTPNAALLTIGDGTQTTAPFGINFGSTNVDLYRNGTNSLKTDAAFTVASDFTAADYNGTLSGAGTGPNIRFADVNHSNTSGDTEAIALASGGFNSTSGSGTFSMLSLGSAQGFTSETINQTGSANGITRGIYINPTVTSATDFRAIETAAYTLNLARSATNLQGSLFNAYTVASTSAATVTNAYTSVISGGPVASTNVTISTSTGLAILGGAVNGGGTVTNSIGLLVNASTGATNNYAAVLTGGNVGIGTTSPSTVLSVGGNVIIGASVAGGTNGTLTYGGVPFANTVTGSTAGSPGSLVGSISPTFTGTIGAANFTGTGTLIDPTVEGGTAVGSVLNLIGSANAAPTAGTAGIIFKAGVSGATETGRIDGLTGFWGIGTTTPKVKLTIGTTTGPQLALTDNTSTTMWTFHAGGTTLYVATSTNLGATSTNPTLTLTSGGIAGNLGVATSAPWRTFAVSGTAALNGLTNTGENNALCYNSTTGEVMTHTGSACTTTSDQRLKTDIQPLDSSVGLAAIDALNPVSFVYKDSRFGTGAQQGFLAQQVAQVLPNLVGTSTPTEYTPDVTYTVNYQGFIVPVIKAIQQLSSGYSLSNLSLTASSTIASSYLGTTASAITVDAQGNTSIGSTTSSSKLSVAGDVRAASFSAPNTATSYQFGANTIAVNLPSAVLTSDGGADIYKLATYTLADTTNVAQRVDALAMRMDSLEDRIKKLEDGAVAEATTSPVMIASSTITDALQNFGIYIQDGIAQFNTLVASRFVAAADSAGQSSAGSGTVSAGQTYVEIDNTYATTTSKILVTMNSPVDGSWYLEKGKGAFRLHLTKAQQADVDFDFFIVETDGQVSTPDAATTTPNQNHWADVNNPNQIPLPPPDTGAGTGTTTDSGGSATTTSGGDTGTTTDTGTDTGGTDAGTGTTTTDQGSGTDSGAASTGDAGSAGAATGGSDTGGATAGDAGGASGGDAGAGGAGDGGGV